MDKYMEKDATEFRGMVPENLTDSETGDIKEGSEFGKEQLDAIQESLSKVKAAIENALMEGVELPHLEDDDRKKLQTVLERLQGRAAHVDMEARGKAKEYLAHLLTDWAVMTVEGVQSEVAHVLLYTAQTPEQVIAALDAIPNLVVRNSERYATVATMTGGVEAGRYAMKIAAFESSRENLQSKYEEAKDPDPEQVAKVAAESWQTHVNFQTMLNTRGQGHVEDKRAFSLLAGEPVSDWAKEM